MDRKQYWDRQYPAYFRARIAETEALPSPTGRDSSVVPGDTPFPGVDALFAALDLLGAGRRLRWLEVGVGTGRSLPYIIQREPARLVAADISATMLDYCRNQYRDVDEIEFLEAEAEALGLEPESIDIAVCYGTFDALFQDQAVREFARVLAPNGRLLVTGKNNDYVDDDDAALAAEAGARAKGHPNFFTDTDRLLRLAGSLGLNVHTRRYFVRRGDSAEIRFVESKPPHFYEYLFIFEKSGQPTGRTAIGPISRAQSRTFRRMKPTSDTERRP